MSNFPKIMLTGLFFVLALLLSITVVQAEENQQLLGGLEDNIGNSAKEQLLDLYGGSFELPLSEHLFVKEVFRRLTAVADRELDYTLTILNTPQLNAFALPGGHIFITRGLQQFLGKDEHRLAAVLAHEIAHVELKHGLNSMLRQLGFSVLVEFAIHYLNLPPNRGIRLASMALVDVVQSGYSREAELEADLLGQQYLSKAGFDPAGIIRMLADIRALEDAQEQKDIFSTHPLTSERIEILKDRVLDYWRIQPLVEQPRFYQNDPGLDPLGRFIIERVTNEGSKQLVGFDYQRGLEIRWLTDEEVDYATWSPTGNYLAVLVKQQELWEIWLLNRLGGVVKKLECGMEKQPLNLFFSPDSSMIAYNCYTGTAEPQIIVNYLDSNLQLNLKLGINGLILQWSIDGILVWDDCTQKHYLIQPPSIRPLVALNPIPQVIERQPRMKPVEASKLDSGFTVQRPSFFQF